jgi:DNA-binding CsgD family transcriptional regulator
MGSGDLVGVVEAAYAIEGRDEGAWLRGIAERAAAVVGDASAGAYGLAYDASDVTAFRVSTLATFAVEDPRIQRFLEVDRLRLYRENPDLVDAIFRKIAYASTTELPFFAEKIASVYAKLVALGVCEILGINGVNVDGRGAHVGVLLNRQASTLPRDILARLSTHLGAAYRLRRRLGDAPAIDRADAILEPNGKLTHAVRDAKVKRVRAALSEAAIHLDKLRAARRRDPERALRAWRALIDARWSLVDHFERDGRRYVLAQRNEPFVGPIELLSDRERQAVALAAMGHPNKMIGYELGIAVSTVGVLLTRACRKLGATSRRELVAAYERHTQRDRNQRR